MTHNEKDKTMIIRKVVGNLLPRYIRSALANIRILELEYGHLRSSRQWECVDKSGGPIPWYTYPAIEYLDQLDFKDKVVFEWGGGNSSIYWAKRASQVLTAEDNKDWYRKVKSQQKANQEVLLIQEQEEYVNAINLRRGYDVIVIDGSYRYQCSKVAQKFLLPGGMIILDNSDWHPESAEILRGADLIEVDFHGFGPIIGYTWTTSIFLHREFSFKGLSGKQPTRGIGSLRHRKQET